jgi:hypothetical protein
MADGLWLMVMDDGVWEDGSLLFAITISDKPSAMIRLFTRSAITISH